MVTMEAYAHLLQDAQAQVVDAELFIFGEDLGS